MAKAPRAKPAGQTPKPKAKPKRAAPPLRIHDDPDEVAAQDAALAMIETLGCPILVARDQAERCAEMQMMAEEARDYALIAQRLHVDQPSPPLSPLLIELVMTLEQHARELVSLIDRLVPMFDHDVPHAHIEPDDDAVTQILGAMFEKAP